MNNIRRTLRASAGALAVLVVSASATLAGGWAEATVEPAAAEPPTAGQESELLITLLQHGVKPVDFGTVTLTAINGATGERAEHRATHRADGEWVAAVAFAVEGTWDLAVAHSDLEVSTVAPIEVAAAPSGGASSVPSTGLVAGASALVAGLVAATVWVARRPRLRSGGAPRALADRSEA